MDKKRIVVIGGGTGSHTVLTGLKEMNCDLTAVVAMSDDGGSSGRLRDELGQLPPGDVRQCLVALADDDCGSERLRRLFNYRFTAGNGLNGHSVGNLLLSALTEITGSPDAAIREASSMLRIRGTVLPVTLTDSTLKARLEDGSVIEGESCIDRRCGNSHLPISRVYLEPTAYAYPPALDAIAKADAVVIGPGDIYTSILPNFLVEGVAEAVVKSPAVKIHVCNLMTKPGESDGFRASDFLRLLSLYLGVDKPVDYLVANDSPFPEHVRRRNESSGQHPVEIDEERCRAFAPNVVKAPMTAVGHYVRHNPPALAEAIMSIVESADREEAPVGTSSEKELTACILS
jgi:uncharacterized cofD-like protein